MTAPWLGCSRNSIHSCSSGGPVSFRIVGSTSSLPTSCSSGEQADIAQAVLRDTASMAKVFTKRNRPAGLVITPGASADRDHATLVAIEQGIPELPVLRLTLGTTRVPTAVNKIVAAAAEFAEELDIAPKKLAFGGRSFGGRACSVAVAEGLPAAALVLLSYPLHPPGKPENLRTEHFPDIAVPSLFVSGTRDPFGSSDEFTEHLPAIPSSTAIEWVNGNHSPKGNDEIVALVRDFLGY